MPCCRRCLLPARGLVAGASGSGALVGAAGARHSRDCSRRLSGAQRSPVDSAATPAEGPRLLSLLLQRPGWVPRRCLEDLHGGDCSVHSHLSHLDMPVSLVHWPARVGVPHAESRPVLMGTLLDSVQSYGATRCRSPVPQAAVSGKRDSSSVAAVWLSYCFLSK